MVRFCRKVSNSAILTGWDRFSGPHLIFFRLESCSSAAVWCKDKLLVSPKQNYCSLLGHTQACHEWNSCETHFMWISRLLLDSHENVHMNFVCGDFACAWNFTRSNGNFQCKTWEIFHQVGSSYKFIKLCWFLY